MPGEPIVAIVKRRLLGLVFLGLVVGLVGGTIALYNKAFTTVTTVTLLTDHTGNQLITDSDVKVRGLIVGSVRSISAKGSGAKLKLALKPGLTKLIPDNVSAQILPKTLFGERFVSLVIPATPGRPIRGGDVIQQDRSAASIEVSTVLNDLLPVINAVKPAELNATLNALATALQGRGQKLGHTLVTLDSYLKQINPSTPQLVADLVKLGNVAVEYNNAAPDLLATLDNLETTSATLTQQQAALDSLLKSATSTFDTRSALYTFFAQNSDHLISVAASSNQILSLLADYSPEFPCLAAGLAKAEPLLQQATSGHQLHITLTVIKQRGKYVPGNEPRIITGYGPNCFGLPNPQVPFQIPAPYSNLNDGAPIVGGSGTGAQAQSAAATQETVGSAAETATINALIAPAYGTSPTRVPAIATVLAGPLVRGATAVVS